MTEVVFHHTGREVRGVIQPGDSILTVARRAGVMIESPCNGNGTCGKCQVKIGAQEVGRKDSVLACQTLAQSGLTVEIIERHDGSNLQIKQDGITTAGVINSVITKKYIPEADITEVYRDSECIAAEPGDTVQTIYGLTVDIGTTTLVVALNDLVTARELAVAGSLNPQSRLAQDVLSRIRYAADEQGLEEMHRLFIDELNRIIKQVTSEVGVSPEQIYDIVLSGNTCMLHLAARVNPRALGKYPYTPVIRGGDTMLAATLEIYAAEGVQAYLPPVISAYVGADITSGIVASRLNELEGVSLFIDVGTNGEIVLAQDGKLAATSTAAGPAFEGMNISHGMRAAPGAVESFQLTQEGERVVKTIANHPAIGICGSGLLDIVAELVRYGLIGPNGRFNNTMTGFEALFGENKGKTVFTVAPGVVLSQQDIRQVQLAKGAIRAGIEALLNYCGLSAPDVDRVLIAGSFGYHLNPASLVTSGLLPKEFQNKIEFLGNTSKTGGQQFLLNQQVRQKIRNVIADITVLELSTVENFDKLFVKCLDF